MKKNIYLFTISFVCIVVSSCVSKKFFYTHYSNLSICDSTLSQLEGNYSNCPFIPDTVDERLADEYIPLEQFIFHPDYQKKWNESFNTEGEIIIEIISQNEILISYRINDITIKSRIYRGKFINNYFEISTRRKIIGFPLTYFILNIDKLSLGISKEGYLIAASRRYRFGSLFIIFKGNHHSPPLSYFKKKQ